MNLTKKIKYILILILLLSGLATLMVVLLLVNSTSNKLSNGQVSNTEGGSIAEGNSNNEITSTIEPYSSEIYDFRFDFDPNAIGQPEVLVLEECSAKDHPAEVIKFEKIYLTIAIMDICGRGGGGDGLYLEEEYTFQTKSKKEFSISITADSNNEGWHDIYAEYISNDDQPINNIQIFTEIPQDIHRDKSKLKRILESIINSIETNEEITITKTIDYFGEESPKTYTFNLLVPTGSKFLEEEQLIIRSGDISFHFLPTIEGEMIEADSIEDVQKFQNKNHKGDIHALIYTDEDAKRIRYTSNYYSNSEICTSYGENVLGKPVKNCANTVVEIGNEWFIATCTIEGPTQDSISTCNEIMKNFDVTVN